MEIRNSATYSSRNIRQPFSIPDILLLAIILSASCSERAEVTGRAPQPDTSRPIECSVTMEGDTAHTRSMSLLASAILCDYGFGLNASYSSQPLSATAEYTGIATDYIFDAHGFDHGKSGDWDIEPHAFWPMLGYLSFFAYAPANVNGVEDDQQATIPSETYERGLLDIDYYPARNVSNQSDFCISQPLYSRTWADGPLVFNFQHTLCQVLFAVSYKGTLPSGMSLKVNTLTLSNLYGKCRLSYTNTEPYFKWNDPAESGPKEASYTIGKNSMQIADETIPVYPDELELVSTQTNSGRMILLPQTINAGGSKDTQFVAELLLLSGSSVVSEIQISAPLPETVWTAGSTVRYHISFDMSGYSIIKVTYEKIDTYDKWVTPYRSSENTFNEGNNYHID